MPSKFTKFSMSIVIVFLLVSCMGNAVEESQSNKTPIPTRIPGTEPVSIVWLAQTSVSNANYLGECKSINPSKLMEQIPYQNIWPGETKKSELEILLGTPDEVFKI